MYPVCEHTLSTLVEYILTRHWEMPDSDTTEARAGCWLTSQAVNAKAAVDEAGEEVL